MKAAGPTTIQAGPAALEAPLENALDILAQNMEGPRTRGQSQGKVNIKAQHTLSLLQSSHLAVSSPPPAHSVIFSHLITMRQLFVSSHLMTQLLADALALLVPFVAIAAVAFLLKEGAI